MHFRTIRSGFRVISGFTFLEVLLVIILVGLVLAGGYALLESSVDRWAHERTEARLRQASLAIERYRAGFGAYPDVTDATRLSRLLGGLEAPEGESPHIFMELLPDGKPDPLVDAWGGPLIYRLHPSGDGFRIFSAGRDGEYVLRDDGSPDPEAPENADNVEP